MTVDFELLRAKAGQIRKELLETIAYAGSGHPGGSLSVVDILTVLYYEVMNVYPQNPKMEDRDRLILSKGHANPALYCILADKGFFPKEELLNLRRPMAMLQGHPDMKKVPGLEISTGSLGQGLSAANGMAMAGKLDGRTYYTYVILGDGEMQEGQIWEAAMSAAHYKLDNVIAFIDYNKLQLDGTVSEIMEIEPIDEKLKTFGWNVINICGHDCESIYHAICLAKRNKGRPSAIICHTVKGKGVSYMENCVDWHGGSLTGEQLKTALADVEG